MTPNKTLIALCPLAAASALAFPMVGGAQPKPVRIGVPTSRP